MKISDKILYQRFKKIRKGLDNYLDLHCLQEERLYCAYMEQSATYESDETLESSFACASVQYVSIEEPIYAMESVSDLEKVLEMKEETFSTMLLRLIDEKGLKDSEVYKRANIDRRLFSKIRGDEDYTPSKKTALSFCFALHLTIDETEELLKTAGYTLSASSRFDLIIRYLIEKKEYNIQFVNIVLYEYGEGTLSK